MPQIASSKRRISRLASQISIAIAAFTSLGLTPLSVWAQSSPSLGLKIGVVQRFGSRPTDTLTLKATSGDRLTLRFKSPQGDKTLTTNSVKLQIAMKPLTVPLVEERVVLSIHRSFESAEESARQWQEKGIAVEIANPDKWEVWAKREVYNTPLLRRLLLQSLQSQGDKTSQIQTRVLRQVPQAYWILNGFRYNRHEVEITSGINLIQVQKELDEKGTYLYGGSLRLQPNAYGNYSLVNNVELETYLRGVVPHEIGIAAPPTALEAQAILARTYVLRNLRRFTIDNYQLCATPDCQVYKGLTEVFPESDTAIANTNGQVLVYNNELVDALYSSATGGVTAPFNDLWNGAERPYLRAVVDAVSPIWDLSRKSLANEQNFRAFINLKQGFNEAGKNVFRWQEQTTLPEMTQFLQKFLKNRQHPLANIKSIRQVRIVERSPAGRVLKMEVDTDLGTIAVEKDDIRNAFYPPISTLFYIDPVYNPDKTLRGYVFVGGGFGHGVGMSQNGAYRLGNLGWSSERILKFYFPGTQVKPLDNTLVFWRNPVTVSENPTQ